MIGSMVNRRSLADYIRARMKEKNLSAADVSRNTGHAVSPATITKIINGEVGRSSAHTLGLIAEGIDAPKLDLWRLANGDDIDRPLHFQIYAERFDAADLSDSEWQYLELYFKDYVAKWQAFQHEREEYGRKLAETAKPKKEKKK